MLSLQNVPRSQAGVNPPRSERHIVSALGAQTASSVWFCRTPAPWLCCFSEIWPPRQKLDNTWLLATLLNGICPELTGHFLDSPPSQLPVSFGHIRHVSPAPVTAASTPHLSYGSPEWMPADVSPHPTVSPLLNSWCHSSGSLTGAGLSIFQHKRCWVSLSSVYFLTRWRTRPLKSLLSTLLTHDQPSGQWHNISRLTGG